MVCQSHVMVLLSELSESDMYVLSLQDPPSSVFPSGTMSRTPLPTMIDMEFEW